MNVIRVQKKPFDPGAETNLFLDRNSNSGGVASFIGQVRDFQDDTDQKISVLELEHYPGMTEKELGRICSAARARWPLDDASVIHRYGPMKPGDAIVMVFTASAHRADAFAACEFIMDWLKTQAPFWKRERAGTDTSWVDAKTSDDDRASRWTSDD
ncbi:MAG: molybdenum cofactor biosynthesis protein MoaE [Rhodospirillaceae bacterium]|jgi:molybdopterin synthase catalytic subunit|nr:molybdenum cofactor biosynthesis protein MoaE [Rhodospirillaceae bacterium]